MCFIIGGEVISPLSPRSECMIKLRDRPTGGKASGGLRTEDFEAGAEDYLEIAGVIALAGEDL